MSEIKQRVIGEYWLRKLAGWPGGARPAALRETPPAADGERAAIRQEIGAAAANGLRKISRGSDLALFILLTAGLSVVLKKYTGSEELIIGAAPPADESPGGDPLLLRLSLAGDPTLKEVVWRARTEVLESVNHGDYSLTEVLRELEAGGRGRGDDLLRVALAYGRPPNAREALERFDLLLLLRESDGGMELQASYDAALHDGEILRRLLKNVAHTLGEFPARLDDRISEVEVVCADELEELAGFNNTRTAFPGEKTLHELFEEQAARSPRRPAVISEEASLTYGQLSAESDRLAHALRERGVGPEDVVGVMAEPTPEVIIGLLGVLKAGGCYLPINPAYPLARQRLLLEDSGAKLFLTTRRPEGDGTPELFPRERIVLLDEPGDKTAAPAGLAHRGRARDLAYVIYTSGTTGAPKGVMVEHRSVVRLVRNTNYIEFGEDDRILQTSSLEFDASTFEIWGALLNGLTLCLAPKERLLEGGGLGTLIEKYQITILWLTSPLFNHVAQNDAAAFERLRWLLVGGDVVSPSNVAAVKRRCPGLHVVNGYGPTENTTFSTALRVGREYRGRLPIGRPIANSTVYVVDESLKLQPVGAVGELLTGGQGVARGYLGDERLTAEKFIPFASESKVFRTGDLGRWLPDGTIDFVGRLDDQVKVRGYRVEPGEVEACLTSHARVGEILVLPLSNDEGERYLCAYVVPRGELSAQDLRSHLRERLPDYMTPEHFVFLPEMPLNAHGKIDRGALPPPSAEPAGEGRPPGSPLEQKLAGLWREVLEVERVGVRDDFFRAGGHSMKAIKLLSRIHKEFGVKVGLGQFLQSPTIEGLARAVRGGEASPYAEIEKQPERDFYELSVSQKRLAGLYDLDPENAAFNISQRQTWHEPPDEGAVRRAVAVLAGRHESLRTGFQKRDGEYVQFVTPEAAVNLETFDLSGLPPEERERTRQSIFEAESAVPFRLERPPLYRAKLLKCAEREFDLLLTTHHIVSDGWSMDVLQTEFSRLYRSFSRGEGCELEPLRLQFKDYVGWHNRLLADAERLRPTVDFWRETLGGGLSIVKLPYDFDKKRSAVGSESSGYRSFIAKETAEALKDLAGRERTSLFMLLFAAFNLLLRDISGQQDIVTGIPNANRQHEDLKSTVGFFVDSLIVRNRTAGHETFAGYLQSVTGSTLNSIEHAHYPIELACATVGLTWPEILSTFFNMSTFGSNNLRSADDEGWRHLEHVQNSKLEFVLYLTEYLNGVEILTCYYRELFRPSSVEEIMKRYATMLEKIARGEGDSLLGPRARPN